jgi:hypothetical protein
MPDNVVRGPLRFSILVAWLGCGDTAFEPPDAAPVDAAVAPPDATLSMDTRGDLVDAICASQCERCHSARLDDCLARCAPQYCADASLRCGDPFDGDPAKAEQCLTEMAEQPCGAMVLPMVCGEALGRL